jgi:hypothetical protein
MLVVGAPDAAGFAVVVGADQPAPEIEGSFTTFIA